MQGPQLSAAISLLAQLDFQLTDLLPARVDLFQVHTLLRVQFLSKAPVCGRETLIVLTHELARVHVFQADSSRMSAATAAAPSSPGVATWMELAPAS
jgi:hypothetical protein|tara:strand:+ start:1068 stop:1358 length:291 start_codon:yes stop_codon:yes gene_type:complete